MNTSVLTPLALQNAALLARIADPAPFTSLSDLAKEIEVDRSNLNRKIEALAGEGMLARIEQENLHCGLELTAQGEAALAAIRRANGDGPAQTYEGGSSWSLLSSEIAFDVDNARTHSGLSPLEIEEMAASLRDRHEAGRPPFITAPTVRPNEPLSDTDFSWVLVHGERRLRGWKLAVERAWLPADLPIPCPVFTGDLREASEEALIENLQRVDLDNLEAAEGLRKLSDQTTPPTTAAQMARRLGKEERWVMERLKVAREADTAQKQAYRDDHINWTQLRDSVKKPRHLTALEKNPRLALMIAELALISEQATGVWDDPVRIATPPPGGLADVADDLGLASLNRAAPSLALLTPATDWLATQNLAEAQLCLINDLREAALGAFGAKALAPGQWGTPFLNLPPETAATPPQRSGMYDDSFARQLRETLAGDDGAASPGGSGGEPPPDSDAAPDLSPQADAGGNTDDRPTPDAPQREQGPAIPVGGASPSAPDWTPTPHERLALLETAWTIREMGQETRGGAIRGAPVHSPHADPTWNSLFHAKMVQAVQAASGNAFLAVLTQAGLDWIAREYPGGVTGFTLVEPRVAVTHQAPQPGILITPWLRPPTAPPTNSPPNAVRSDGPHAASGGGAHGTAPAAAPAAPGPVGGDIIIANMRQALADLWLTTGPTLTLFLRLIDGDGVGDEELEATRAAVQSAAMIAAQFVPPEIRKREQG